MNEVKIIERWECEECEMPCVIEIHHADDKLPDYLKCKSKFRHRYCPCKEATPQWVRIDAIPEPPAGARDGD